jgi:hypothetical protein
MWKRCALVTVAAFWPSFSDAGRGGHTTTFDANIFGGSSNISCLCSGSVAGVCATGYSATCNGVADDSTAVTNWRNAVKGSSALAVLYIAPGKTVNVGTSGDRLVWDGAEGSTNYVPNSVIWAYGASANFTQLGGGGIPIASGAIVPNACAWAARISTASAGATSITIPSGLMVDGSSDAGVFPAGTPVMITGVELQVGGYPPNFQWFEYGVSTGQSGNVVSLASPLVNSYESTWPTPAGCVSSNDLAGAATIYKMIPSFATNMTIYGLTNSIGVEVGVQGRDVALHDVVMPMAFPSASANWFSFGSQFGVMEVDKEIQSLNFYSDAIGNNVVGTMTVQSSSVGQLNMTSVFAGQVVGLPRNTLAINTNFGNLTNLGLGFGLVDTIKLDGTKIINVSNLPTNDAISYYSYSSGTFSVAFSSMPVPMTERTSTFMPGYKYHLAYYIGGPGIILCSPDYVFTVSDISTSGSNFQATSTSWTQDGSGIATPASLPALTNACGGNTANKIVAYAAKTITQINSPAGSTNITGFAQP